jgi:predicted alpha/beta superfamily hydrolase
VGAIHRLIVSLSLCFAAATAGASEFEYLQSLRDTSYFPLESTDLERSFHIYVTTPDAYDDEQDRLYPTVYLLDGGALHPMLVAYQRYLQFGEEIPPVILVAISYGGSDFASGNFRSTDYTAPSDERDYWGGAEKFQAFLETAVIPLVESRFRSNPKRRILFGQSLGGS